jgi:hypothetical protein
MRMVRQNMFIRGASASAASLEEMTEWRREASGLSER